MPHSFHARLGIAALIVAAFTGAAGAQSPGVRVSPQFVQYKIGAPSENTISEMSVPVFAFVPLTRMLRIDVGTAFASARVTSISSGQSVESSISGLTDTQIRATLNMGTDFVVLTAGVNVPTGRATAAPEEQAAASLIGNDFLVFPISSMGSGLGGTGGLAIAHPLGDWNVGAGFSVRHSMPFDPFEDAAGAKLRYTPGDEMRGRVGVDHPYGTGRVSLGVTYSKFTDDDIEGSIYNTGDRLLTQGYVANSLGAGSYLLSAWNLFRASGTRVDGTASGTEDIGDVSASYGFDLGAGRIEPGLGVRTWMQADAPLSIQSTISLRYEQPFAGLVLSPSAGFTIGRVATAGGDANATSGLTGFRAQLTIRTR
jgi:hypothetical protein